MFTEEQAMVLVEKAVMTAFKVFSEKRYPEAEILLNQVLKVNPDNVQTLQLLGLIRHNTGKYEEGIDFFTKALEYAPENAENHNNISVCYSNLGKYDLALPHMLEAVALAPHCHYMQANLGLLYRNMRDINKAIEHFKKAITIKESDLNWTMLGGCYGELRMMKEAEECFQKAIAINPEFAAAHVDLASVYHLQKDNRAWGEYEWRFEHFDQTKFWLKLYDIEKRWYGEKLEGKKIIIHSEQGLGDCIQFARYIPLVREKGAYVIVHCQPSLASLLKPLCDEVYTTDPGAIPLHEFRQPDFPIPEYDYFASVVSLPYLLELPPIPKPPYLFTDHWCNLGASYSYDDTIGRSFKIGVVWAGNPQHPNDRYRSCKLAQFKPIHDLPGVKLFSLQTDTRLRQYRFEEKPIDLTEGSDGMKLVDMSKCMDSFEDTASIMKELDLVISADTATLHLAGAFDIPTWALIPANNDWRWGLEGEKTEWYPSVRLFRQPVLGDWDTPFQQMKEILNGRLSERKRR
jgi:tetratricopeptide (TPR) repeat protein